MPRREDLDLPTNAVNNASEIKSSSSLPIKINNTTIVTVSETETNIADGKTLDTEYLRIRSGNAPEANNSTGSAGQIAWDANYIYVCTDTNTWVRGALSTW